MEEHQLVAPVGKRNAFDALEGGVQQTALGLAQAESTNSVAIERLFVAAEGRRSLPRRPRRRSPRAPRYVLRRRPPRIQRCRAPPRERPRTRGEELHLEQRCMHWSWRSGAAERQTFDNLGTFTALPSVSRLVPRGAEHRRSGSVRRRTLAITSEPTCEVRRP